MSEESGFRRRDILKTAGIAGFGIFPTAAGVARGAISDGPNGVHVAYGDDPQRSLRVGWSGVAATEAYVEYGETDFTHTAPADATVVPGEDLVVYDTTLDGLDVATEYQYRAVLDGTASKTFTVRTAPDATDGFRVTAVGDHGIADPRNPAQRADDDNPIDVISQAAGMDPDVHLGVGDLAYANGYPFTWEKYFDAFEEFYATTPFLTVPGNHEKEPGQGFTQYDARLNQLMPMADVDLLNLDAKQRWHDFRYGNVQFVGLNTSADACGDYARGEEFIPAYDTRCRTDESYFYNEEQKQYVEETLRAASEDPDVKWIVAYFHSGFWTDGDHDARADLRDLWGPYFDTYDVDLVLSGHNHSYERSKPIRGDSVSETGTTYVVNGTGGTGHYGFQHDVPPAWTAFRSAEHYGVVQLDITDDTLTGKYVNLAGDVVDEFRIVKTADGEPTQRNPGDAEREPLGVSGTRRDDGDTHGLGSSNHVRLTTDAARPVRVRDMIPVEWTVTGEGDSDPALVDADDAPTGKQYVYFDVSASDEAVEYVVEAPSDPTKTGQYTFGPFQAREVNGTGWVFVEETDSTETVV